MRPGFSAKASLSPSPSTMMNGKEEVDPLDEYMATIDAEVAMLAGKGRHDQKQAMPPAPMGPEEEEEEQEKKDRGMRELEEEEAEREEEGLAEREGAEEAGLDSEALKRLTVEEIIALAQKKSRRKDLLQVDHSTIKYAPFRKDFYVEAPEIARMTEEEVAQYRNELGGIKIRGAKCPRLIRKWTQCGLNQRIMHVIQKCGYSKPTPIQAQAIPAIMSGRDIIGIAKTGSGKTIAFLLPMLRHVLDQPPLHMNDGPIALIMTPTRELALQTYEECRKFTKVLNLRVVCAYGGAPLKDQIADMKRGAEIVICTPGRLIDLLAANSGRLTNLRRVTYLVLDEADRMFDMGFGPQVLKIVANVRPEKQAVLFSATFPKQMEALARKILQRPLEIVVGQRSAVCSDVEQEVEVVDEEGKFVKLLDLLGRWYETRASRILVFVDRQDAADNLLRDLIKRGYHCISLHGGKDQADRDSAIADFKSGDIPILIATSVAARGLDVKELSLVINYECPNHMEDYVHRVGRTGRAGRKGTAITFITPQQDRFAPEIVKALRASNVHVPPALQQLADGFLEKVRAGSAHSAGSGFGGKGLERIDEEHERMRRTQKRLMASEEADNSEEEEEEMAEFEMGESNVATTTMAAPPTGHNHPANSHIHPNPSHPQIHSTVKRTRTGHRHGNLRHHAPPKTITTAMTPEALAMLKQINEKVAQAGADQGTVNPQALINARYGRTVGGASGEVLAVYDRPAAGAGAVSVARSYFSELEINGYPQTARYKITHKDTLGSIMDMSSTAISIKGEYLPAGKQPRDGQRSLYIRIDGETEIAVEKALCEVRRVLFEATFEAADRGVLDTTRYSL